VRPSFLVGNQHAFIEAHFINSAADSAKRIDTPLTALTFVEEVPDSLFDQFVRALIAAASKFLLDLRSQIRW
jgi:hypothetical protein